eukprot:SAG11_NODE_27706_length_330_cov_0.597403_1_plen_56_part_01
MLRDVVLCLHCSRVYSKEILYVFSHVGFAKLLEMRDALSLCTNASLVSLVSLVSCA